MVVEVEEEEEEEEEVRIQVSQGNSKKCQEKILWTVSFHCFDE